MPAAAHVVKPPFELMRRRVLMITCLTVLGLAVPAHADGPRARGDIVRAPRSRPLSVTEAPVSALLRRVSASLERILRHARAAPGGSARVRCADRLVSQAHALERLAARERAGAPEARERVARYEERALELEREAQRCGARAVPTWRIVPPGQTRVILRAPRLPERRRWPYEPLH